MPIKDLCLCFNQVCFFHILDINPFIDIWFANSFAGWPFHSMDYIVWCTNVFHFDAQTFFILMRSSLLSFALLPVLLVSYKHLLFKSVFSFPCETKQVSTEPGHVSKCRLAQHQQQCLNPRPDDGTSSAASQLPQLPASTPAAHTGPAAGSTVLPAGGRQVILGPGRQDPAPSPHLSPSCFRGGFSPQNWNIPLTDLYLNLYSF